MIIRSPRQVVLFSLSLLLSSFGVLADRIKLNQPLPHIQITDKGELMINQKIILIIKIGIATNYSGKHILFSILQDAHPRKNLMHH